jgi:prophage regulatory protein
MADRFLPKAEVSQRVSLCPASIDRKVKGGTFPMPIRISENRVAWLESEIDAWIAKRAAEPRERKPSPAAPNNGYRGGRPRKMPAPVAPEAA